MFADVVVTSQLDGEIVAVCRTFEGIHNVRCLVGGAWTCSCGSGPACEHVEAVRREIEQVLR